MTSPSQHPLFDELTPRQRAAVNEVWEDTVAPALEEARTMTRRVQVDLTDRLDMARAQRDDARSRAERLERELWMVRVHGGGS